MAIAMAWRQTYILAAPAHNTDPAAAVAAYEAHIVPAMGRLEAEHLSLVLPLGWPLPFTVADLLWGSLASVHRRSEALLSVVAAHALALEIAQVQQPELVPASILSVAMVQPLKAGDSDALVQALNMLRAACTVAVQHAISAGAMMSLSAWLRALAARMHASSRAGPCVHDAAAVAEALAQHTVCAVVSAARQRSSAARFVLQGAEHALPLDPDAGISVSEEHSLRHDVAGADERRGTASALLCSEALLLACLSAAQSGVTLASAQRNAASTSPVSQLDVCLARAISPEQRVRQPAVHACVDMLPPLLHTVATLEAAALNITCTRLGDALGNAPAAALGEVCNQGERLVALVTQMARWRDRMVALLLGSSIAAVPEDALLVAWLRLRKGMLAVATAAEIDADISAAAHHAAAAMDSAWGISALGAPKPLLWRRAGHPRVPSTAQAVQAETQLRSLCEHPSMPHDPRVRASLVQAACFFSWSHAAERASNHVPALGAGNAVMLLEEAQRLVAQASTHAASVPADCLVMDTAVAEAAAATCDSKDAHGGVQLVLPTPLHRWPQIAPLATQLHGLASVASMRATLSFLAALSAVQSGDEALALVRGSAGNLLEFTLNASDRGVLDVAPLQQLVWLADAEQSGSELSAALPDIGHELWFRFHAALSRMQTSEGVALSGAVALFRPTLTACFADLAAGGSKAPISGRAATVLQLRLAVRALRSGASLGVAPGVLPGAQLVHADARAVTVLTSQLLAACSPRWPMCGLLSAAVLTQPSTAAVELQRAGARDDFAAADTVAPLLDAIAKLSKNGTSESCRGTAWTLLGCTRLALLVTELLADPAARDASKLASLSARRDEDVRPELHVRSAAAALPGAPSDSRARARAENALCILSDSITRLERRAVPRPAEGHWTAVYTELSRFAAGLGCVPAPLTPSLCQLCSAQRGMRASRE